MVDDILLLDRFHYDLCILLEIWSSLSSLCLKGPSKYDLFACGIKEEEGRKDRAYISMKILDLKKY